MTQKLPLIYEELYDQSNYGYLMLVEYKKIKYLTVIENLVDDEIQAYVLDQLSAESIDQDWFLSVTTRWFYSASDRYPLSFEFTKLGKGDVVKKVLKTFNVNSVSRLIGKIFVYPLNAKPKVKRRRVFQTPETVAVKFKNVEDRERI